MTWKKIQTSKGYSWQGEQYKWIGAPRVFKYKIVWTPLTSSAKKDGGVHTTYHKTGKGLPY